jgi:hypothetical protein
VKIFGSSANGLATNGSDLDMTLLFNNYLFENQHKQLILPKIVVKQLKTSSENLSNEQNSNNNNNNNSDSNSMINEIIEELDTETVDSSSDMAQVTTTTTNQPNNADCHELKECIKKFFVK